jgi:ATP-binding cassette subfamily B protein
MAGISNNMTDSRLKQKGCDQMAQKIEGEQNQQADTQTSGTSTTQATTTKRLVQYALRFKKTIIIALVLLSVAVAAELTGPFIAKKLIDDHILGIESVWYQTEPEVENSVPYGDAWYKRADRFEAQEPRGAAIHIVQAGPLVYVVQGELAFIGERSVEGSLLTVRFGEQRATYEVTPLSSSEVFAFYQPEVKYVVLLLSIYVGLLVFAAFFQYGKSYMLQVSANKIIKQMRMDVFQQIQRVSVDYFDNKPAGQIVSRITNDTEAIRELYIKVLSMFFTSFIYMTGIFIALFLLDTRLATITLLILPILVVWVLVYRRFAATYNQVIRTKISEINGMINESIQGMRIIRLFRRQEASAQHFVKLNDEHYQYQNKLLNLDSLTSHNLSHALKNVTLVAVIWYFGGASLGISTAISLGVLYAFVDYIQRLFQPVTDIVNQLTVLEQAKVAGARVFELMDEPGEAVIEGMSQRYQGHVRFERVWFAYQQEEYVLKDISFEVNQGKTVALVGHTGSGKSSMLNLLFRFYDPDKGHISIDGQDITLMPKQHLRQHMGIVLQDPFLFSGTIASNVNLDDPAISREQVIKALHDVGAAPFIQQLTKQYDEPVLEKGSTLSAGQRQLISFARALAFNPAILILDEATANIDTETEAIIQQALDVLKQGRTTFIIAHRLSTTMNADQILVLDRGVIVERVNHESLLKAGGRYYQMYQLQQGQARIEQVM